MIRFLSACLICTVLYAQPNPPILETTFRNPAHAATADWARAVCGGKKYFVNASPPYEWMQVLHPDSEADDEIVGASGVAVSPKLAGGDVPFSHPFGLDWELFIVPDMPYRSLLAPSNGGPDGDLVEAVKRAAALGLTAPGGTLSVETDRDLVPPPYRTREGDRVVVFGRWIVDCGHTDFHSEIHPPLLLASARRDGRATAVSVISRPWLVGQRFEVDDEAIRGHLANEVIKVETYRSTRVEAHSKILKPFSGLQHLTFTVRPPVAPRSPDDRLQVTYHFTVRQGVTVEVSNAAGGAVRVLITMDAAAYKPAPLPRRKDWDVPLSFIGHETDAVNMIQLANIVGHPLAGLLLQRDWLTDRYDAPKAPAPHASKGKKITVDDTQPFPIAGEMRVKWKAHVTPRDNVQ